MNKFLKMAAFTVATFGASAAAFGQEYTSVVHGTAEWVGYTEKNGNGIYNELFEEAFAAVGIDYERSYMPLNRAIAMVERGDVDMTGGFAQDGRNLSTIPVLSIVFSAMYPKTLGVEINSAKDLKGLRVVAPPQLGQQIEYDDVNEVETRSQAAATLMKGRADVYIDIEVVLQNLRNTGISGTDTENATVIEYDVNPEDWIVSRVRVTDLFMLFAQTDRGNALKEKFDEGLLKLVESGRYAELFTKYDQSVPDLN